MSQPTTYDSPPCPIEAGSAIEFVPPTEVTAKISGGTEVQQSVIHQILAGMGPTRIDSVEVATEIDKAWGAPPGAVGIDVRSSTPEGFTHWQAQTVAFIFGRRSLELGLPKVWYIGNNGDQAAGIDFSEGRKEVPITRDEAVKTLHEVIEIEAGSGVWVRPDLLSCSPYADYGSPNLPEPPPCPA